MSEENKNIDDLIKKGFDSSEEDFDFSSWDSIEEKLNDNDQMDQIISSAFEGDSDDDFDFSSWHTVKNKLDNRDKLDQIITSAFAENFEEVPADSWDNVSESLDIDTVWKHISKELDKRKRRAFIWWNAAGIALLVSLSIPLINNYLLDTKEIKNQSISQNNNELIVENNEAEFSKNNISFNATQKDHNAESNSDIFADIAESAVAENNRTTIENSSLISTDATNNSSSFSNNNELENISTELTTTESTNSTSSSSQVKQLDLSGISKIENATNIGNIPPIEITPKNEDIPIKDKRWVIGTFAAVDNGFISDATAREGFSKNSLIKNNLTVSLNYGIYGQYYFNNNSHITSQFYWNSSAKRHIQTYEKLRYTERKLELDYYKYTLSTGKDFGFAQNKSNMISASVGGFISYLKQGKQYDQNGLITDNTPHKKWNYGLLVRLGYQKEFNNWIFGTGIQSQIGLKNIFKGTEQQSSVLNKTRTYTNGLYFRVGYKL